jgi:NAD(P)-dependent dehydrogenase (short-subunit alcohol dehydrogenase family)
MSPGRVIVVTGASSGIGRAAAKALAREGDRFVLLGRDERRLASVAGQVHEKTGTAPDTVAADFADLGEVRRAGAHIAATHDRVDILANNAGALRGRALRTPDGHEATMQVNHLAGFLLAHLLLERMRAAPAARLITTSSLAEAWGWLDVDRPMRAGWPLRSRWVAYGASKQANILFTREAARRWGPLGITPTCLFPGLVRSRFATSSPLFMVGKLVPVLFGSSERGADTLVWLATTDAAVPGGYYFLRSPCAATPRATSPERAERLWAASLRAAAIG